MRTIFEQERGVSTPPARVQRTKAKRKVAASSDSTLRSYMQAMGSYPTFTAEQEQRVAIELRQTRCARWAALLCYPPLVPSIVELIEARLEVDADRWVGFGYVIARSPGRG